MHELQTQAVDMIQKLDEDRLRMVLDYVRHLHDGHERHHAVAGGPLNGLEALLEESLQ
jgi:hypothetical protein